MQDPVLSSAEPHKKHPRSLSWALHPTTDKKQEVSMDKSTKFK